MCEDLARIVAMVPYAKRSLSAFPSGNQRVRLTVEGPEFTDRVGVAGHWSDTGGEFTGSTPNGPPVAAKGPRMVAKARLPTSAAHEQTTTSEFATSVWSFDGQAVRPEIDASQPCLEPRFPIATVRAVAVEGSRLSSALRPSQTCVKSGRRRTVRRPKQRSRRLPTSMPPNTRRR